VEWEGLQTLDFRLQPEPFMVAQTLVVVGGNGFIGIYLFSSRTATIGHRRLFFSGHSICRAALRRGWKVHSIRCVRLQRPFPNIFSVSYHIISYRIASYRNPSRYSSSVNQDDRSRVPKDMSPPGPPRSNGTQPRRSSRKRTALSYGLRQL
jgi:hypothetical protein